MKNNIIGLKELRLNIQKYVSFVKAGESFVIVKKSKPIFKIVPAESEEQWETVADFTKINKDGVPAKEIIKELNKLNAES
jgi:prevent-host-death family protein